MKICIIQRKGIEESPIICELSALLKQEGNETYLLIHSYEKNLLSAIKKEGADIIAIQSEIGDEEWSKKICMEIRENFPKSKIVSFGSIPTFYQEKSEIPADFLVVGEPEVPFLSLINFLEGKELELINVISKDSIPTKIQPTDFDLDSLPMPDREIYYSRYKVLRDFPVKRFLMSRGCVLSCSFCYISGLKNIMGKIKVRFKSPERVVKEVLHVFGKYPLRFVHFSDDLFPVWNRTWLEKFCKIWKDEIKLPFSIVTLSNFLNDKVSSSLKEAGCKFVIIGVETYNEKKRIEELEKTSVTNSIIEGAVNSLSKFGIKAVSINIVGLPGEDIHDWFKTAEFNRKTGISLAIASEFVPIPKTPLGSLSVSNDKSNIDYVRNIFSLASRSKLFQKISLIFLGFEPMRFILSKIGEAYLMLKLKSLYEVRFLEGLIYFIRIGRWKDRRANLHQIG